jgi:chaperone modulatory protein CbpM
MTYAIVHQPHHDAGRSGLPVEQFAAACGLHPQLVARLVALGLLDADTRAAGGLRLPAAEVARAARIVRLRTGLGLTYTAVGVVLDLLDRTSNWRRQCARSGVPARTTYRR